jgi:prepilin-type N-terminal cleavage/methylation domain-containing protein
MKGFTLVEVMVVTAITVILSGLLVANFSRTAVDLQSSAIGVQDALREAQSLALAGAYTGGSYRCGYGVHFESDGYLIYAGAKADELPCSGEDRNYNLGGGPSGDVAVRTVALANPALVIDPPSGDIFFEPPDPTTYVGGSTATTATIRIHKRDAPCPGADCRVLTVSPAGRIQQESR